ncbi:hypothetical protein P3X46_013721 [Hevea brasiliensis]|uniref:Uncharacterized protein n=1 Tax=Hevea brasiliensis TaxID=3981 RepID=A0ABQ9M6H2_HEVBR|nr:hypothetical protein P3X46_013721 [Hevea brasiliensis]
MAKILLLCALFFLSLIIQGELFSNASYFVNCQCEGVSNITVVQAKVQKKWPVTITINCICTRKDIKLDCKGFQVVNIVNPPYLGNQNDDCIVTYNGGVLPAKAQLAFTYVSNSPFGFRIISTTIACS